MTFRYRIGDNKLTIRYRYDLVNGEKVHLGNGYYLGDSATWINGKVIERGFPLVIKQGTTLRQMVTKDYVYWVKRL